VRLKPTVSPRSIDSVNGMIKKCPICNRTYADETISFCLADGSCCPLLTIRKQNGPRVRRAGASDRDNAGARATNSTQYRTTGETRTVVAEPCEPCARHVAPPPRPHPVDSRVVLLLLVIGGGLVSGIE